MDDSELWGLMQVTGRGIAAHYRPVIERILETTGLDGRALSLLLAVRTLEPDNTTPAHLLVRDPYSSAELYFARLASTARLGYLGEITPGEFRLTKDGRKLVDDFIQEARQAIAEADLLPSKQSSRLAEIMGKLVKSCLGAPPPPNPWSIGLSFKLMPEIDPPLPYTEQTISCLAAYRDDAHLAAWRNSGLSAIALEILTLIWRNQVDSLKQIGEQLSHRGHRPEVYVDAVDELKGLNFIHGSDNDLQLTEKGRLFRDAVEEDTNAYFFAPWSVLSGEERKRIAGSLNQLMAGLKVNRPE